MWTGMLLIALLAGGCGREEAQAPAGEGRRVPETAPQETPAAAPPSATAASDVILMDGELVSAYPSLSLAFPENAVGRLQSIGVSLGQRVEAGDLLAVLDEGELTRAVRKARRDLDRALEDQAKGEADVERNYQRQSDDAQRTYDRAVRDAEQKYERELEEARRTLAQVERDLQQAQMQPPTTSLAEAEAELNRALTREADAADAYEQALDRPWERQEIRDSLYKDWQAAIVDRELAQLRLEDAQIALRVYRLDLAAKREAVENASADLEGVEKDPVDPREEVEREVNLAYERAVEDARLQLAEAEQDLENARLYAPWDGLVLSIEAGVGSTVGAGQAVVVLLNVEALYFVTQNLSERHVAQLQPGQRAQVTLRAYPDVVLGGTVDVVLPKLDRAADTDARFVAYIRLDESALDLLPGMTGRVEVVTGGQ
jgi:multidrug resistance efflux pump